MLRSLVKAVHFVQANWAPGNIFLTQPLWGCDIPSCRWWGRGLFNHIQGKRDSDGEKVIVLVSAWLRWRSEIDQLEKGRNSRDVCIIYLLLDKDMRWWWLQLRKWWTLPWLGELPHVVLFGFYVRVYVYKCVLWRLGEGRRKRGVGIRLFYKVLAPRIWIRECLVSTQPISKGEIVFCVVAILINTEWGLQLIF